MGCDGPFLCVLCDQGDALCNGRGCVAVYVCTCVADFVVSGFAEGVVGDLDG